MTTTIVKDETLLGREEAYLTNSKAVGTTILYERLQHGSFSEIASRISLQIISCVSILELQRLSKNNQVQSSTCTVMSFYFFVPIRYRM